MPGTAARSGDRGRREVERLHGAAAARELVRVVTQPAGHDQRPSAGRRRVAVEPPDELRPRRQPRPRDTLGLVSRARVDLLKPRVGMLAESHTPIVPGHADEPTDGRASRALRSFALRGAHQDASCRLPQRTIGRTRPVGPPIQCALPNSVSPARRRPPPASNALHIAWRSVAQREEQRGSQGPVGTRTGAGTGPYPRAWKLSVAR